MTSTAIQLKDIRTLSLQQLKESLLNWGEKPFRAKQIYEWLWKKSARSFDEMTNLSVALREKLKENFCNQANFGR